MAAGTAAKWNGNATETFPDIDQLNGTNGFTIPIVRDDGLKTLSEVGDVAIGDLNNDGFDDVIVSESLDMVSEFNASVSVRCTDDPRSKPSSIE